MVIRHTQPFALVQYFILNKFVNGDGRRPTTLVLIICFQLFAVNIPI